MHRLIIVAFGGDSDQVMVLAKRLDKHVLCFHFYVLRHFWRGDWSIVVCSNELLLMNLILLILRLWPRLFEE